MNMLLAIVYETADEKGRRDYRVKLRLMEEKPYSMMARGMHACWTNREVAVLVENRHDLDKAAKLLGRTREACRKELQRLGLSKTGQKGKNSVAVVMVFPEAQIDLRRAVVKQVLPRLKKLFDKIDKADELAPETINDLAKIVRATAALLNALEKWETGEEMLEIWRAEEEEEDADQPGF